MYCGQPQIRAVRRTQLEGHISEVPLSGYSPIHLWAREAEDCRLNEPRFSLELG
jgi:hypothetical protein